MSIIIWQGNLVFYWSRMPIRENVEGDADLLHLLCNSIRPKGVAILAVQVKGFFNSLRHFYAKFVGPFDVAGSPFAEKGYNLVTLLQYMGSPPVKGWLVVNALGHCIFCGLQRVRLLEVSKILPGCEAILPLAAHLPTNGTAFHIGPSIWSGNFLVRRSNPSVKLSMVND